GNERIIAALARVKSYLDYGAFTPVQVAATAALNGPEDCIREMRETYRKRRDALVESFGRAGWDIPPPQASMFAWAPLPKAFEGVGSMEFATLMVEKSGVVVSPGVAFGEHGEGFVRIAMVENEQRIRQAARGVRRFLESGIETLHNVVPLANRREFLLLQVLSFMVAPLKVGIAGLGTVGAEVVRLIEEQSRTLSERSGRGVRVVAVTARSKAKKRSLDLRGVDWAKSPLALASDSNIDCFVEL